MKTKHYRPGVLDFILLLASLTILGFSGCQSPLSLNGTAGPSLALTLKYSAASIPASQAASASRLLLPASTFVTATLTTANGKTTTVSQTIVGSSVTLSFPNVLPGQVTLSATAFTDASATTALFSNSTTATITPNNASVELYLLPVNPTLITDTTNPAGSLANGASVSFKYTLLSPANQVALTISPTSLNTYLQNSTGVPVAANISGVVLGGGTDGTLYITLYNTTGLPVSYTFGLAEGVSTNYNIIFNVNGGSGSMSNQVLATGATANLDITAFTFPGYTFSSWNTAANGSGTTYLDGASYTMGAANLILYAQWSPTTNTVTFNPNGGTGAMINQSLLTGNTAALTTNAFSLAGYSFAGWNTLAAGSGTTYANGANFTMGTGSVTLFAQWTPNNNSISFNANGGTGTMANQILATGANAILSANTYTNAGYSFTGWNTVAGGTGTAYAGGTSFTMGTANVNLYAQWSPTTNTVTFNANGGTGTMANQTILTGNTAALTSNTFTRAGYSFANWNTLVGGTGTAYANGANYTMGASSITLYAQWTANNNTITFNPNGGTGSMANQILATAATANLTANSLTRAGYAFSGWNTASNGTGTAYAGGASYTMGTANVTLYAQWTANNNTITFNANGGTGTMANQTIATAATANLNTNAFTRSTYAFAGWNTLANGTGTAYAAGASYTMGTASVTLYAQWNPTITFNANGGTGTMAAQTIAANATANLNANSFSRAGYTFGGWNTLAGGTGTAYAGGASYTIGTTSITLYAQWTPKNNTITFNANGGTGTMANQTIATAASANLTANAFTQVGYSFANWNSAANGSGTAYSNGVSYTMGTANVTLYAQWTPNNNTVTFNANGGTGTMANQTIATAATANLTANTFTYALHFFTGWNTAADGSGTAYAAGAAYTMGTANVTLYAQWAIEIAYVANFGGNSVSAWAIDPTTGALAQISGSPYATGSQPQSVTADPTGKFLYVGNYAGGSVSAYTITPGTGALTAVSGSPFATGSNPQSLKVDPSGKFLYVANRGSSSVSAFAINATTGALTAVSGSPFATGSTPISVTVDPSGKFVCVTNSVANNLSVFSLNATTGALTAVSGSPFATGNGPWSVTFNPAGQFAYVANRLDYTVSAFSFNSSTGALTVISGSPYFTVSSGLPYSIVVDPSGKFVYTANYGTNNLSGFVMNTSTGTLSSVPNSPFAAGSIPTSVAVDPSGKFVYATNYSVGTISAYSLNTTTGGLTAISGSPFTGVSGGFALAIIQIK